ncbi:MAG: hypothetical protein K8U57_12670 [Planctomycetes bacterium]|nr:hypothetical protein [Planctomycetota bacterium]
MEPAEQTDVYDFLYRDPSRVASYYAQLHGGQVLTTEIGGQSREATENLIGGSLTLAKGERKKTKDYTTTRKEQLAPHDTATVDMIGTLKAKGKFWDKHPKNAPNGSLVQIEGTLSFADSAMLRLASSVDEDTWVSLMSQQGQQGKYGKPGRQEKATAKLIKALLQSLEIPSVYFLWTPEGTYVGSVKEAGLDEPIGGYYYKHGDGGLPGAVVVGIRETATPSAMVNAGLVGATLNMAQVLRNLVFPEDAIRVAPLAIYRRL